MLTFKIEQAHPKSMTKNLPMSKTDYVPKTLRQSGTNFPIAKQNFPC